MRFLLALLAAAGAAAAVLAWTAPAPPGAVPAARRVADTDADPGATRPVRRSGGGGVNGPVTPEALARANLAALLNKLRRARKSAQRARLIEAARARLDEFTEPLLEILSDPLDGLVLPAIALAVGLGLRDANDALGRLGDEGSVPVRAAAIRALGALDGWFDAVHSRWLRATEPAILIATLEVYASRPRRPIARILGLLTHPAAEVRRAAAAAIPPLQPGRDLDALCRLATTAREDEARAVATALGNTALPPQAEAALYAILEGRRTWTARQAALWALRKKRAKLERPEVLVALLANPTTEDQERAACLITLETTRSVPVDAIAGLVPTLHPVLQVLAARCLIAGGRDAVPLLIELLATEESPGVDDEARDYARSESRKVLAELAGRDLGAEPAVWLRWYGENKPLELHPVSSAPVESW